MSVYAGMHISMHACLRVCIPLLVLMSVSPSVCALDAAALRACALVGVPWCAQRLLNTHTHTHKGGRSQAHPACFTFLHFQVLSRFLVALSFHEALGTGEGIHFFEAQQHLRECDTLTVSCTSYPAFSLPSLQRVSAAPPCLAFSGSSHCPHARVS